MDKASDRSLSATVHFLWHEKI